MEEAATGGLCPGERGTGGRREATTENCPVGQALGGRKCFLQVTELSGQVPVVISGSVSAAFDKRGFLPEAFVYLGHQYLCHHLAC